MIFNRRNHEGWNRNSRTVAPNARTGATMDLLYKWRYRRRNGILNWISHFTLNASTSSGKWRSHVYSKISRLRRWFQYASSASSAERSILLSILQQQLGDLTLKIKFYHFIIVYSSWKKLQRINEFAHHLKWLLPADETDKEYIHLFSNSSLNVPEKLSVYSRWHIWQSGIADNDSTRNRRTYYFF